MIRCRELLEHAAPRVELLWASPRELNVFHAETAVVTATGDMSAKLALVGKDLAACSLDTVKMFEWDSAMSGFRIRV